MDEEKDEKTDEETDKETAEESVFRNGIKGKGLKI